MTELRTLVLEDSTTDAELAVFELERAGLRITAERVSTRDGFIRALREFKPDVVLADYSLPNFDGAEALHWVTEHHPHVPVIIVTGALGDELAIELIKAGARDYVLKSNLVRLGPAVLRALAEVQQVLAREQAERNLAISAVAAAVEREKLLASLEQRVEERTAQLRAMAFELTKTEERERQAIARDLHDGLGQTLAIAKIRLGSVAADAVTPDAAATLAVVETLIDQSNRAVRSLAEQLSPPVLYDLGLVPALDWLVDQLRRDFGLRCEVRAEELPDALDQSARAILFRAVRELLMNIVKHAEVAATLVRIDVSVIPAEPATLWQIVITDSGKGFDPQQVKRTAAGGFGLMNVRERLTYIGGTIQIDSELGRGTEVTITMPLQSTDALTNPVNGSFE